MNNLFGRCDACVRAEGNHFRRLFKYGESTPTLTPTYKPIRMDPDSQQSERAENGVLPAVARNGPSNERRELSDKTVSLYSLETTTFT